MVDVKTTLMMLNQFLFQPSKPRPLFPHFSKDVINTLNFTNEIIIICSFSYWVPT
jgi:hypothetical protein